MNCTMPGGDSTTMTKAEMLKAAKAALGDKKPEGVEYPVENRTGAAARSRARRPVGQGGRGGRS